MEAFGWIIMLLFFGVAVKMLFMAVKQKKRSEEIRNVRYRGTAVFFIMGKGSTRKNNVNYRWFDIATQDGKWRHTITAEKELYKQAKKGDKLGQRDLYTPNGKNEPFVTVPVGEKPDISGEEEKFEVIAYILVAIVCIVAGIVMKNL